MDETEIVDDKIAPRESLGGKIAQLRGYLLICSAKVVGTGRGGFRLTTGTDLILSVSRSLVIPKNKFNNSLPIEVSAFYLPSKKNCK
jgi:hypothetical protein